MNIQDFFGSAIQNKIGKEIAAKIGLDESTTQKTLNSVLPKLLGQLGKNAETDEQARKIEKALDKGHNNPNLHLDIQDGNKILSHIMGGDISDLIHTVANEKGISSEKSNDLLALASSFIMENLGRAKNEGKIDATNISKFIKMGTGLLDKNGNGQVKDDIFHMIINFFKRIFGGK